MLLDTIFVPFVKGGIHNRPLQQARSRRNRGVCGSRARLRRACRTGGQGVAGEPPALGAWLLDHGSRWQSFVLNRASPQGITRDLGRTLTGPGVGGAGPAAHVDHRCDAERGWPCPGAQLDPSGAPTRRGGSTGDRGSQLLHPGSDVWHGSALKGLTLRDSITALPAHVSA